MKRKSWILGLCLLGLSLLSGCGGEKEVDEASTRVIALTITPVPSPTPLPVSSQTYLDASATKDGVTMTNGYLMNEGK